VDTSLLRFLAEKRPQWNIVLVGRNSLRPEEFQQDSNIVLLGERDYEDLPSICRYADVGIIPFVDSELTRACNPLKLYEYLAAGLPVVSTDIPEVRQFSDFVQIGRHYDGFVDACERVLKVDRSDFSPRASAFAQQHDWNDRVEAIYSLITA
jgi:glycosyltransferase involved in cell wall biosynthesis